MHRESRRRKAPTRVEPTGPPLPRLSGGWGASAHAVTQPYMAPYMQERAPQLAAVAYLAVTVTVDDALFPAESEATTLRVYDALFFPGTFQE